LKGGLELDEARAAIADWRAAFARYVDVRGCD